MATSIANAPSTEAQKPAKPRNLALLTGAGQLPIHAALKAKEMGYNAFVYSVETDILNTLKPHFPPEKLQLLKHPGMLDDVVDWMNRHYIDDIIFVGKFKKWTLLRSVRLDERAIRLWKKSRSLNDDHIMSVLSDELESEGFKILPQADFIRELFIKPGRYSNRIPTEREEKDIEFGFQLAKEMGRLDVGQTVIVNEGMVIAVEAIEGTDEAIKRSKQWNASKKGVVVKVEKPNQDTRFDIPTVGPRTMMAIKNAGLTVLAVEAGKTLALEVEKMTQLANKHGISFVAV